MISLDIFADPICPWCLIGKARLDRALESRPNHPFQIRWRPFQLNPDMPPEGMPRGEYMALKFGNEAGILRAYGPVVAAAEEAGISLNLGAITRTPNTLNAHRLIHWAGLEGRQSLVMAVMMRAYFQQGQDIGDRDTLLAIATGAGMEADLTARLLDSNADSELIVQSDRDARARGITGVPFFVVAGQHGVQGAQPADLWQQVIDEVTA
jgi:predicted DsbA family dithiol-disulfide isomerase